MQDQRQRYSEDERRGWRGPEERRDRPYDDRGESRWFHRSADTDRERGGAEGSWRDQGDGGYFEPSRGRWDDDRRYTRSRQDRYQDRGRYDATYAVGGDHVDDEFDASGRPQQYAGSSVASRGYMGSRGADAGYGESYPDARFPGGSDWSRGPVGFGGSYGRGAGRYADIDRGDGAFDRGAAREPWSEPNYAGRGPKDYQRSDERIREEVSERLTDDRRVDASDVVVEVKNFEVTLSGTVRDRDQKRRAEDLAEQVSGVREVSNHLRVSREHEDRAGGREYASGGTTSGNKPKSGSRLP